MGKIVAYTFGCDQIGLGFVKQVGPGEKLDFKRKVRFPNNMLDFFC